MNIDRTEIFKEIETQRKSHTFFILINGNTGSGKTEILRDIISVDTDKYTEENSKINSENNNIEDRNKQIKKDNKSKSSFEKKDFETFQDLKSDYVTINSKNTVAFKGCAKKALERLQEKISEAKKKVLLIDDIDLLISKFPDVVLHLITRTYPTISTTNSLSLPIYDYEALTKSISTVHLPDFTFEETMKIFDKEYSVSFAKNNEQETIISTNDFEFIINASLMFLPDCKLPETPKYLLKKVVANLETVSNDFTITQKDIINILDKYYDIKLTKKNIQDIQNKTIQTKHVLNLKTINQDLEKIVIGQNPSIQTISKTIKRSYVGFGENNKPKGSFLLLGQTGVGKTETAKALAKTVYGNANNIVRFDMSEYHSESRIHNLIGSSRGYVAYEEGGDLTNAVKNHSKKVILLDEVEKAHPKVFDILLQLLDEGRLTDSKGTTYSYKDAIIIMTSNLKDNEFKSFFRPEFLNRLDNILNFNELTIDNIHNIFDKLIVDTIQKVENKGYTLNISPSLKEYVCEMGFDPSNGARPLKRAIEAIIEDEIIDAIINDLLEEGDNIILDYQNDTVKLFNTTHTAKQLVV